jgi:hypothetical protein
VLAAVQGAPVAIDLQPHLLDLQLKAMAGGADRVEQAGAGCATLKVPPLQISVVQALFLKGAGAFRWALGSAPTLWTQKERVAHTLRAIPASSRAAGVARAIDAHSTE